MKLHYQQLEHYTQVLTHFWPPEVWKPIHFNPRALLQQSFFSSDLTW